MRRIEKLEGVPAEAVDDVIKSFKADGAMLVTKDARQDDTWTVTAQFTLVLQVIADSLALRNGPGTHFTSIAVLPRGTTVEVQSKTGPWCSVAVLKSTVDGQTGQTGWVYEKFLSQEGPPVAG